MRWEKLKDTFPSDCPNYIHTLYIYIYTLLDEENHIYMYNTEMDRQYIFARPSWYGIVAQLNWLFAASTIFTVCLAYEQISRLPDCCVAVACAQRDATLFAFLAQRPFVRLFVCCTNPTETDDMDMVWTGGVWPLSERAIAVSMCQYVNVSVCVRATVPCVALLDVFRALR